MTEYDQEWFDAMKAKGHMPYVDDDGDLDCFALEHENHNGPGCQVCGWLCCMHCVGIDSIPQCTAIEITTGPVPSIEGILT